MITFDPSTTSVTSSAFNTFSMVVLLSWVILTKYIGKAAQILGCSKVEERLKIDATFSDEIMSIENSFKLKA